MPKKAKKQSKKSQQKPKYVCEACGLVITVDEACGCAECDLICCGQPMKPKK